MTAFDIFLLIMFIAAAILGFARGFGRTFLDSLSLYAAVWFTGAASSSMCQAVLGASASGSAEAMCQLVTLAISSTVLLVVSRFVYSTLLWDLGMFDKLGGVCAGLAIAVILGHGIVTCVAAGDAQQTASLAGGLSQELLTFSDCQQFVDGLTSAVGSRSNAS